MFIESCSFKEIGINVSPFISIACCKLVGPLFHLANITSLVIMIIFVARLKQQYNFELSSYLVNIHLTDFGSSFVHFFWQYKHMPNNQKSLNDPTSMGSLCTLAQMKVYCLFEKHSYWLSMWKY